MENVLENVLEKPLFLYWKNVVLKNLKSCTGMYWNRDHSVLECTEKDGYLHHFSYLANIVCGGQYGMYLMVFFANFSPLHFISLSFKLDVMKLEYYSSTIATSSFFIGGPLATCLLSVHWVHSILCVLSGRVVVRCVRSVLSNNYS